MSRTNVNDLIARARESIDNLSPEEVGEELEKGTLVVDVRDVRERWRDGAVPGARHVPRGMLEFWADPESEYYKPFFDLDKRVVLYCARGHRSALSAASLQAIGFTDVAHLDGGFAAWKDAGRPVDAVEKKD